MKIFSARFRNVRSPVPRRTLKVYKLPKSIFVRGYYRLHIPLDSFSSFPPTRTSNGTCTFQFVSKSFNLSSFHLHLLSSHPSTIYRWINYSTVYFFSFFSFFFFVYVTRARISAHRLDLSSHPLSFKTERRFKRTI